MREENKWLREKKFKEKQRKQYYGDKKINRSSLKRIKILTQRYDRNEELNYDYR